VITSKFDPELIRRHDVSGPRYTSYPTADRLAAGDWSVAYASALQKADLRSLSLYVHVPFCSTICFYCGCNKINTANLKRADSYVQRLVQEMALQSTLVDGQHCVEQLHFGGGTPTFLNDEQFSRLFDALHSYFNLAEGDEHDFSIEIDPRAVSAERIAHLAKLGINRISIGVQDFDPMVQLAVNRVQSVHETKTVIDSARDNGVSSINIDLINGLPLQNLKGFERTLDQVIELDPDRLSLYSYAHLPERFKTQRQIRDEDLPNADTKLELMALAIRKLSDAGFEYIGMDHFARPTDPLVKARDAGTMHRNFQGYTTHEHCELVSLGVSSIGNVGRVYVQNAKSLHDYYEAIDAGKLAIERGIEASDDDVIIGNVIQHLMCQFELDYDWFQKESGQTFRTYFADRLPRLRQLEDDGLISISDTGIKVTPRGRFLVRIVCMVFDAGLSSSNGKFSKAI
jgi:oxygen-independent coproporphyrinogen-3 oxidase